MEKIFFVSDVHISGPKDPRYKRFLAFIDYVIQQKADGFVILGDLFEFFYGSSSYTEKLYPELFKRFNDLHDAGMKLFYLYGNHDFNFKIPYKYIQASSDLVTFVGKDEKLFAYHGDGLDPHDH
jgi:UDP-2,3-diacylglucosamine hydrolase